MAKTEFLRNVKTARNLFAHRVHTDHAGLNPDTLEGQLARATIWLTPSSVKGFDARDFSELAPEVRERLNDHIEQFRRIAREVPPTEPAPPAKAKEAMRHFLGMLKILKPYLPEGGEIKQVRDALEKITFPEGVLSYEFELGDDSTGDPAVWVWVVVDERLDDTKAFLPMTLEIEDKIRKALAAAGSTRWPYVLFRTAAEQRAL
jgi:hypothetical protein